MKRLSHLVSEALERNGDNQWTKREIYEDFVCDVHSVNIIDCGCPNTLVLMDNGVVPYKDRIDPEGNNYDPGDDWSLYPPGNYAVR